MAAPGLLKTRIDTLKKKIAGTGPGLKLEQRRRLTKRLRRLQRARRTAVAQAAKASAAAGKDKAPATGGESAAPTA